MYPQQPPNGQPPLEAQPMPAQWSVSPVLVQGEHGPERHVLIECRTLYGGPFKWFFTPHDAKAFAANLERAAGSAATGLVLPPGI